VGNAVGALVGVAVVGAIVGVPGVTVGALVGASVTSASDTVGSIVSEGSTHILYLVQQAPLQHSEFMSHFSP